MSDDVSDDAPTLPAIPLRTRQRHRIRPKRKAPPPKAEAPKEELPPTPAPFDEGAEDFFRTGDSLSPSTVPAPPDTDEEPSPVPVAAPPPVDAGLARRRRLARLVSLAVGFSTVLCVVALARSGLAVPRSVPERVAAAVPPPPSSPPVAPEPAVAPTVDVESPAPEAAEAAIVREEARALLAKRALADAIVAAKRAVDLDPSDAESWLILGAAQLDARRGPDAAASFRSCVRLATTGPVAECRAFLR
jgi:hypothetical protein